MKALDKMLEGIQHELAPRPKPPTAPPIPRTPVRPSVRPSQPSGLTPTPAVETIAESIPPVRPTPPPPLRPSATAIGSAAGASPYVPDDDEGPTNREQPRTTMQTRKPNTLLFAVVGLAAAVIGAVVVFLLLTRDGDDKPAPVATQTPAVAGDATKIEQECRTYERTEFWKELKECADRLKPHKPTEAAALWKKGDDEAANAKKWAGVQKYIEEKDFAHARDLVKRIGEDSVYSARARKLLDEAEQAP